MNSRIKTLLKLSSIPNFKLSETEKRELEEWKAQQVPIKPKRKMRSKPSKTASKPSEEPKRIKDTSRLEKVQNVITPEDLTLNEVES